ncbi:hypothetical protein GCM10007276_19080 [Agaricicola taiwanensis]|uniref:DUF2306 domain-containing protein n=1 Tax=Agaricicola taiwanensis TaxID=591372 RepID=A0A8J2VUP5_9RHOB|nr:hypothetical protein [Agaricicola taiwanensis]GGE41941.1 hypothetical protein GCM10007276_19080 [Agaricicola taiwanensis]
MSYVLALVYIHTAISLVALVLGFPAIARLFRRTVSPTWTQWFLITAVATSVTGFMFPFVALTPAFVTGIIALTILGAVLIARYVFHCAGAWRPIYAVGVVLSVYLLAFVTVVQAFQKLPVLNALAPTQTEPPFVIAQLATFLVFLVLSVLAGFRFTGVVAGKLA